MSELATAVVARSAAPALSPQRRSNDGCRSAHCGSRSDVPDSVVRSLQSPGRPLPDTTRATMERGFAHDFSAVRVHTDATASASAKDVGAHAYTVGRHVVFGQGQYAPDTHQGTRLLAHELTHTIQQGSRASADTLARNAIVVGTPDSALEQEADTQAARIAQGQAAAPATAPRAATGLLQREPAPQPVPETRPVTPPPSPKCGPDATDWFVTQVNTAMTDAAVLRVQADLSLAGRFAAFFGLTVAQLGEAGGTLAATREESKLSARAPARTPDARRQLAAGERSLSAVVAAAPRALGSPTTISPLPSPSTASAFAMVAALAAAALGWRALVNHGARYDFKAHTMNHPRGTSCPDDGCPPGAVGIITLCPGSNPQNCYESDLPGNLFYALIGRFIGWSELTLQLGSQYAELTDTARPTVAWDTPDDTAAIALGYALPLPLTRGALCSSIGPARATLDARHGCQDCLDPTTAAIR
jgi:hypothetical protein